MMDLFEINSLLRLLRSSIKHQQERAAPAAAAHSKGPNPAASNQNFITSGQRLETLKALRRQLRQKISINPQVISLNLVQSIFDILKQILIEIVVNYFGPSSYPGDVFEHVGNGGEQPTIVGYRQVNGQYRPVPKPVTVENVFATAVRRNEILEIIQTIIELVQAKSNQQQLLSQHFNETINANKVEIVVGSDYEPEDNFGRLFLPEMIMMLGKLMNMFHKHSKYELFVSYQITLRS